MTVDHPAEWSKPVMAKLTEVLEGVPGPLLDFYAGINGLGFLDRADVIGNELEPEWASQIPHPATVGLAQTLPFRDASVGAIVTSSPFSNRMGDAYLGSDGEKCRDCSGVGFLPFLPQYDGTFDRFPESLDCERCSGAGKAKSTRRTYPVYLGRMPGEGSTAALIWSGQKGREFRDRTEGAIEEAKRVLVDGGLLVWNMKDHTKTHGPQGDRREIRKFVVDWLLRALLNEGFRYVAGHHVTSRHYAFGANGKARVEGEEILVVRKPTADELRWP